MSTNKATKEYKFDLNNYHSPTFDRYGCEKKKVSYLHSGKVLSENVNLLGDNIPHSSFDSNGDEGVCKLNSEINFL
jgi:hypothetical protein